MNHNAAMQSNDREKSGRISWGEGQNLERLTKAADKWLGKKLDVMMKIVRLEV